MNITSPSQFGKLRSLLGKSPVVLVFVYADWCGHCQTFKPDWKKLEVNKSRNMPMVAVRDDMLSQSPLNNMVTADGYPTVTVVSPATNVSINLPTREPTALTNLVNNADKLRAPTESQVNSMLATKGTSMMAEMPPPVAEPAHTKGKIRLFDEGSNEAIQTQKPPTQVRPVTRDTVEPPVSEMEFEESQSKTEPMLGNRQLGGVYSSLKSYMRRKSAAP